VASTDDVLDSTSVRRQQFEQEQSTKSNSLPLPSINECHLLSRPEQQEGKNLPATTANMFILRIQPGLPPSSIAQFHLLGINDVATIAS
jgi:hypothetical protein